MKLAPDSGVMRRLVVCALPAGIGLAVSESAQAHSFGRLYNLPVPLWMYVYGSAAALVLSFLMVGYFVSAESAVREYRGRELGDAAWLKGARRYLIPLLKLIGILGLLLCMLTGFFGTRNPYTNFNMTFFWIVFILGFTYLTTVLGDLFAVLNPWRVIANCIGWLAGRAGGSSHIRHPWFRYPVALGYWPALLFYMAFIWIELFGYTKPFSLAVILLAYSGLNLLGVWLIGAQAWFRYCEFLGVFLRLIAKMAVFEFADSKLRLRAPFTGLLKERAESTSLLVFVLFMLSSTAFDGLHETAVWINLFWSDIYNLLKPYVGSNPIQAYPLLRPIYLGYESVALVLSPFIYLLIYLVFISLAKLITRSEKSVTELAQRFAFSLLPIALVYNITHYYTLILTQGIRVISLVSDPFGFGWNLFGTAQWLRAPIIPDAGTVWHTQVLLILAGHIVSVYIAHLEALRTFPTRRQATLSQLPMLFLMVVFTTIGLWILAQPIKSEI